MLRSRTFSRPLVWRAWWLTPLLLILAATAATACGGGGDDGSNDQVIAAKDRDRDGVPDRLDKCPNAKEDLRWTTVADGCPDTIVDLVELGRGDIAKFWETTFANEKLPYDGPKTFQAYDTPISTGCGKAQLQNAFYCAADHSIYYDVSFLNNELKTNGDFGPVFILAHEWGHLIQDLVGLLDHRTRYTIDIELQADCFAGLYTHDASERGLLEQKDVETAIVSLFRVGDSFDTPWFEQGAHGTPGQRIDAFLKGSQLGVDACFSRLNDKSR